MFHRAARLALGNPDRSRRWIPPGPGGLEAARRPHGRVTVLVAVLVTAPGDGPRPGGGPRRGREPEGDATASWPSNGISSGTRDREGRGAGEPEAPGQWHRDPNPRPSLSVSGEFSGKLGILSAASPRSSPQSRGIYGRLARAQPGVSRDPTPPNAPPMRAEARSRRPVSPIPGLPGKEGAGEVDMRGEGSWSGEGVPGKAMLGAESVAFSFAPRLLPPPACPLLPCLLSLLSALARSARPIPSPCSFASRDWLRFLPAFSLLDRVFARPFPGKTLSARAFRPGATRPRCERSRGVPVFHRVAGLASGKSGPLPAMDPAGTRGPKAARRPQG